MNLTDKIVEAVKDEYKASFKLEEGEDWPPIFDKLVHAAITKAISESLPEQKREEWIDVNERLPEPYQIVLVADSLEVRTGFYDSEFKKMAIHKQFAVNNITHWQPLPQPPKPKP